MRWCHPCGDNGDEVIEVQQVRELFEDHSVGAEQPEDPALIDHGGRPRRTRGDSATAAAARRRMSTTRSTLGGSSTSKTDGGSNGHQAATSTSESARGEPATRLPCSSPNRAPAPRSTATISVARASDTATVTNQSLARVPPP
jgi:hypothetical protein